MDTPPKFRVCAILLTLLAAADCNAGVTINAASASYADVSTAVSSATNGDTVTVPAGPATWNTPLVITKCITLQGAGIGNTVITSNITDSSNGVISFKPDASARAADDLFRITGFTIDGNSMSNCLYVYNDNAAPVSKVRLDHNHLLNAGGLNAQRGIFIYGTVFGVADHNAIENCQNSVENNGTGNGNQWGWLPVSVGTNQQFFFEDNHISIWYLGSSSGVVIPCGHGGRYVFRYNTVTYNGIVNVSPVFDMHGNQLGGLLGTMCAEIYGNDINLGAKGGTLIDERGGTLMIFDNKVTWGSNDVYLKIREEFWDQRDTPPAPYLMHVTNSYYWGIFSNGSLINYTTHLALINNEDEDCHYTLAQNQDFWFQNPSYNGTTQIGIYVGTTLPAHCTKGDGAWITGQSTTNLTGMVGADAGTPISGTFYRATATDTWTPYYTPYTYPHPLTTGSPATVAPTNAKTAIQVQ